MSVSLKFLVSRMTFSPLLPPLTDNLCLCRGVAGTSVFNVTSMPGLEAPILLFLSPVSSAPFPLLPSGLREHSIRFHPVSLLVDELRLPGWSLVILPMRAEHRTPVASWRVDPSPWLRAAQGLRGHSSCVCLCFLVVPCYPILTGTGNSYEPLFVSQPLLLMTKAS